MASQHGLRWSLDTMTQCPGSQRWLKHCVSSAGAHRQVTWGCQWYWTHIPESVPAEKNVGFQSLFSVFIQHWHGNKCENGDLRQLEVEFTLNMMAVGQVLEEKKREEDDCRHCQWSAFSFALECRSMIKMSRQKQCRSRRSFFQMLTINLFVWVSVKLNGIERQTERERERGGGGGGGGGIYELYVEKVPISRWSFSIVGTFCSRFLLNIRLEQSVDCFDDSHVKWLLVSRTMMTSNRQQFSCELNEKGVISRDREWRNLLPAIGPTVENEHVAGMSIELGCHSTSDDDVVPYAAKPGSAMWERRQAICLTYGVLQRVSSAHVDRDSCLAGILSILYTASQVKPAFCYHDRLWCHMKRNAHPVRLNPHSLPQIELADREKRLTDAAKASNENQPVVKEQESGAVTVTPALHQLLPFRRKVVASIGRRTKDLRLTTSFGLPVDVHARTVACQSVAGVDGGKWGNLPVDEVIRWKEGEAVVFAADDKKSLLVNDRLAQGRHFHWQWRVNRLPLQNKNKIMQSINQATGNYCALSGKPQELTTSWLWVELLVKHSSFFCLSVSTWKSRLNGQQRLL